MVRQRNYTHAGITADFQCIVRKTKKASPFLIKQIINVYVEILCSCAVENLNPEVKTCRSLQVAILWGLRTTCYATEPCSTGSEADALTTTNRDG